MNYRFINTEYLDSVSGGDPDIINEIVSLFEEQCIEIYDEMLSLNLNNEYFSLGLLAHKIKSSVAIMGMNDLAAMLKTFEVQAKEGNETHLYESYIARFKAETDIAVVELKDLINTRLNNM